MAQDLDLGTIFKAVSGTLLENKDVLNQADTHNHDHGDHMVQIFDTVQKAVIKKKSANTSEQLAYASQQLAKKATSGSAKVYAEGLNNASKSFMGKNLSSDNIGTLIQSMMGIQQPTQETNDSNLLGSLLGGLTGAGKEEEKPSDNLLGSLLSGLAGGKPKEEEKPAGNMLGSLLSGLTGSQAKDDGKLDAGDLLSAGMAFFQAKQQGGSNLQAIMQALAASSPLGASTHRTQSGALIINTIMNMLKK